MTHRMYRLRSIMIASRADSAHNATARLAHCCMRAARSHLYHSSPAGLSCTGSIRSGTLAAGRGRLHCCLNVAVPRRSQATSGPTTDDLPTPDQDDTDSSRTLFQSSMLWPVQTLTAFAAIDTVGTVAVMVSMLNHTDKLPEEYRWFYLSGFAMFACVPPLLLASLQWIRTRLVTSIVECHASKFSDSTPSSSSMDTTITLGFASLFPGGVGSQRSFALRDLRTEYDGGIAYLVVQDSEAAQAAGLPTSYVLDPIEMAQVWSDDEQAAKLLALMNRMGG